MYDELLKRLREKAGAFDYDGWVETACDYEQAADAIEELIAKLNHADEQIERLVEAAEERRWIPVTERLPSEDSFTLIFTAYGHAGVCYFTNDWWGGYDKNGITHWMPLPTPPKAEEGE